MISLLKWYYYFFDLQFMIFSCNLVETRCFETAMLLWKLFHFIAMIMRAKLCPRSHWMTVKVTCDSVVCTTFIYVCSLISQWCLLKILSKKEYWLPREGQGSLQHQPQNFPMDKFCILLAHQSGNIYRHSFILPD